MIEYSKTQYQALKKQMCVNVKRIVTVKLPPGVKGLFMQYHCKICDYASRDPIKILQHFLKRHLDVYNPFLDSPEQAWKSIMEYFEEKGVELKHKHKKRKEITPKSKSGYIHGLSDW